MGTVFRKSLTKPVPDSAELFTRQGRRFARWKDSRERTQTAGVTTGQDGSDRILIVARTYTAKYRDGAGHVREVATGCRDELAARAVLAELERRAELVKAGVMTTSEDRVANHQSVPLTVHLEDYLSHLQVGDASNVYVADTRRLVTRVVADLGIGWLSDITAHVVERWLAARGKEGMAARTRNSYRQAMRGFCEWCVERDRLGANPLERVRRADERSDRKRQRRAMTPQEVERLLHAALKRPLAEYGRETERKPAEDSHGRKTWRMRPLTFESLAWAEATARQRLEDNPGFITQLEATGRERALIYKTLVLTGLRQSELASLTIGQLHLDGANPYADLHAADEKNRHGAQIPIRSDLAADLQEWIKQKRETTTTISISGDEENRLTPSTRLFNVPDQLVKILDRDLAVAGIAKRDDRGRTIDVHALRHTFGTLLSKAGVAPRTAQAAMRHSKIDLTMNVYTDPRLLDLQGAVGALPSLPLDGGEPAVADHHLAMGTDCRLPSQFAPEFAPTWCKPGHPWDTDDNRGVHTRPESPSQSLDVKPSPDTRKKPLSSRDSGFIERGRRGSNPQPPDRQSGTLTN